MRRFLVYALLFYFFLNFLVFCHGCCFLFSFIFIIFRGFILAGIIRNMLIFYFRLFVSLIWANCYGIILSRRNLCKSLLVFNKTWRWLSNSYLRGFYYSTNLFFCLLLISHFLVIFLELKVSCSYIVFLLLWNFVSCFIFHFHLPLIITYHLHRHLILSRLFNRSIFSTFLLRCSYLFILFLLFFFRSINCLISNFKFLILQKSLSNRLEPIRDLFRGKQW